MINAGAILICVLLKTLVHSEMTLAEKFDYTMNYFKVNNYTYLRYYLYNYTYINTMVLTIPISRAENHQHILQLFVKTC